MGVQSLESLIKNLVSNQSSEPLRRMLISHLSTGGKRLRSQLIVSCTEALGGDAEVSLGAAAACELFHNATLIHDDLQDGDRTRRGAPALWTIEGANQAINAGDLMLMLPTAAINEIPISNNLKWKVATRLNEAAIKVISGQALEPELTKYIDSPEFMTKYLECIRGKTAALFVFTIQCACLLTGKENLLPDLAHDFEKIGLIFQVQDDVLDLYGNKGRDQKGEDIREGKISMLVVQHLRLHPKDSKDLIRVLGKNREETSDEDVETWIRRFQDGGALRETLSYIRRLMFEVESSENLLREPQLKKLVTEVNAKILEPVQEVWNH